MVEIYSQHPDGQNQPLFALRQQEAGSARPVMVAPPASCAPYHSINILRLPDVMKRVGLKHSAIYLRILRGQFPKQISLGGRAVGWLEHEIDAWLMARVQQARGLGQT